MAKPRNHSSGVDANQRIGGKSLKRLVSKALRRMVQSIRARVRKWEEEAREESSSRHPFGQNDFVYPWLNHQFTTLLREGAGLLRPKYTWGVLHGAYLARALGIHSISVIEFGVAGGNGLVSLETIAQKVEARFGMSIDVFGFDTGRGLPKPVDYRDMPNLYAESDFTMDSEKLIGRLKKAHLVLGPVEETLVGFIHSRPNPVAFISFDLDYYTSTIQAFKLLEADYSLLLPRIHCYFDDMLGFTHSDYTGERLAITEFNTSHPTRKISPIYGLRYYLPEPYRRQSWSELFYLAHFFDHPLYSQNDGLSKPQVGGQFSLRT
jgi:hypothetical protein